MGFHKKLLAEVADVVGKVIGIDCDDVFEYMVMNDRTHQIGKWEFYNAFGVWIVFNNEEIEPAEVFVAHTLKRAKELARIQRATPDKRKHEINREMVASLVLAITNELTDVDIDEEVNVALIDSYESLTKLMKKLR